MYFRYSDDNKYHLNCPSKVGLWMLVARCVAAIASDSSNVRLGLLCIQVINKISIATIIINLLRSLTELGALTDSLKHVSLFACYILWNPCLQPDGQPMAHTKINSEKKVLKGKVLFN